MLEKIPIRVRNAVTDGLIGYISWSTALELNRQAAHLLVQVAPILAETRNLIEAGQFAQVDALHVYAGVLLNQAEFVNDATFIAIGLVYIASAVMLYNSIQFVRSKFTK